MTTSRRPAVRPALRTALRTAALAGAAGLVLSGCTGDVSPGVAATVGEETLSVSEVDRATRSMCTSIVEGVGTGGQSPSSIPLSFVRQGTLQLLALDAQARQIAEAYDVEPGADHARERAGRMQAAEALPAEARADYVKVMSANALAVSLLDKVGRAELARSGGGRVSAAQAGQAGLEVFRAWPQEHGIDVDPRYGLEVVDGQLTSVDTHTSVAVSDSARQGLVTDLGQVDPAYLESLPSSQRCG